MILIPKDDFFNILKHIFQKKHDFMFLDLQQQDTKQIHKNFTQLIVSSPNITEFNLEEEV